MPKTLNALAENLNDAYPVGSNNFRLLLLNDVPESYALGNSNVNTVASTITLPAGHTFVPGVAIALSGSPPTFSPAVGFSDTLYIESVAGNAIKLSATRGGAALSISFGNGAFTLSDLPLDKRDGLMSLVARKELGNYQGVGSRPDFVPVAAIEDAATNTGRMVVSTTLNNAAGAGIVDIAFNKIAIVEGASATPKNTAGTVDSFIPMPALVTVLAGSSQDVVLTISST